MDDFQTASRFLIASRIGKRSLHADWLDGAGRRGFDVLLSCYDPDVRIPERPGVTVEHRPGAKVAGYAGLMRDRPEIFHRYDYICFMDEDIRVDADTLAGLFDTCSGISPKIAQPALAWGSYFSYAGLMQQPNFAFRHVNFIEMMCPIFRSDILKKIQPLYELGLESGIDLIWCNEVYEGPRDFAVIDAFPVLHTEPVGGRKADNGFTGGREYESDILDILDRYGLPRLRLAVYEGVLPDGRRVTGRLRLALASLSVFGALPRQPKPRTLVKCGADMLAHQIFHGARNVPMPAGFPSRNG